MKKQIPSREHFAIEQGMHNENVEDPTISTDPVTVENLEIAQGLLDDWVVGTSTPDKWLSKIRELLPNATLSDEPAIEELASLVKRYRAAQRAAEY